MLKMKSGLSAGIALVLVVLVAVASASHHEHHEPSEKYLKLQRFILNCTTVLEGQGEEVSNSTFSLHHLSFRNSDLLHVSPKYANSLEFSILQECVFSQYEFGEIITEVDMLQMSKAVLQKLQGEKQESGLTRRQLNTGTFMDGFWSAVRGAATRDALNLLTGGVYNCVYNVQSTARDLFSYFRSGSPGLVSILRGIAGSIYSCISAASNGTPIGWLRGIYRVARAAYNIGTITSSCGGLISVIRANSFNSQAVGYQTGQCVSTLVSVLARRRRASEVPSTWICDPSFYNNDDGCDIECGAFDPDCLDPAQPIFVNELVGAYYAPPKWVCPSVSYNGTDGCDVGCGAYDPDCDTQDGDVYQFSEPVLLFDVASTKAASQVLATGEIPEFPEEGTHNLTTGAIVGIIVATVVLTAMVIGGVMMLMNKRRKNHTLLSEESYTANAEYSLQ